MRSVLPNKSILVTRDGDRVPIGIASTIFPGPGRRRRCRCECSRAGAQHERAPCCRRGMTISEGSRFRTPSITQRSAWRWSRALDGRWLQVNRSAVQAAGLSQDSSSGGRKRHHPPRQPGGGRPGVRFAGYCARAMSTYQLEKRYFDRDGNVVWALSSVSLVRTADGSPSYFINQIEDISERKQAEAERDQPAGRAPPHPTSSRRSDASRPESRTTSTTC